MKPRRQIFARASPDALPEESIPISKKRGRQWDRANKAHSYRIPAPLQDLARQVREDVNSIAHFDEHGQPRNDETTADQIASVLIDRALSDVGKNPDLITPTTNRRGRGKMTVYLKEWDGWGKPQPIQQLPRRPARKKQTAARAMFIGYRWIGEIDKRIRQLATDLNLPAGEVVLRLLQIGVEAYKNREFTIAVEITATVRAVGWE